MSTAFNKAVTLLVVTILLVNGPNGAAGACVGDLSDTCISGFHGVPCDKRPADLCCIPCQQQTGVPVRAPVLQPVHPPTTLPVQEQCPTFTTIVASGAECLLRNIPVPYRSTLGSCQDLDSLLSDVDIAQRRPEDRTVAVPAWLTTAAFQVTCPDLLKHFALTHIEFKESRGCRGVYQLEMTYIFGQLEYAQVPVNCLRPANRPGTLEVTEVFNFQTRHPVISELEPSAILLANSDLQCLSDLPGTEPYWNKTLSVGSDCQGGAVSVTYHLRKEVTDLPVSSRNRNTGEQEPVCFDRKKVVRSWETRHPVTNAVCPDETLSHEFRVEDTQPPTFVETLNMIGVTSGESVYVLECYNDLATFHMEFVDNCDKTRRFAATTNVLITNITTTAGCENHARAEVVFIARDNCGNEIRRTVGFLILDTHPPVPLHSMLSRVYKTCRRHVPTALPLEAMDNCARNGTLPLLFPLMHQDYTFVSTPAEREQEAGDGPRQLQLLCENDMTITQTWQLTDGCSLPVNVTREIVIKDQEAPLWISSQLPPLNSHYQCRREVDRFNPESMVLVAKDECDQIEISVVGTEQHWGPAKDSMVGCTDNARITRTWEASDTCGNKRTHNHVIDVLDTTPPALVDKFAKRVSHFCLSHADNMQHNINFICFPDMKEKMAKFLLPDNCGEQVKLEFRSVESYSCSNPETLESCETRITATKGTLGAAAIYPHHYYAHNDTLCISKRASQLHYVTFRASDVCGNAVMVKIDIFAPKRTTDDQAYDPRYPTHPCDDRTIIALPTEFFKPADTFIGNIYMATRVDPGVKTPAPWAATSDAISTSPGLTLLYFTMGVAVGLWFLLL